MKDFIIDTFVSEEGVEVLDLRITYSMIGTPNKDLSNIVWIVHPFTASTKVNEWWTDLFGPKKIFDPNKYCIICPSIPGSPYGSTHPLDINPKTNKKYYYDFPVFTPRDVVDIFDYLRQHLRIPQIDLLIGASMGGQIVFQWIVSYPKAMKKTVIIAADAKVSSWMVAMHVVQKNAIKLDPTWGELSDKAGLSGMNVARQMAVISYRSSKIFHLSQSRSALMSNDADETSDKKEFENVQEYLQYQGEKFMTRFDTFSYCALIEMMNRHDISKGYASMKEALARVKASVMLIGVDSDVLFLTEDIKNTAQMINNVMYKEISSVYGHDAFLIEKKQIDDILQNFLLLHEG